jgi:hypothetical protein
MVSRTGTLMPDGPPPKNLNVNLGDSINSTLHGFNVPTTRKLLQKIMNKVVISTLIGKIVGVKGKRVISDLR